MGLTDVIQQRKTIKLFDNNIKIPREELSEMLELAQLAPSKANVQPWRFVVVDDPQKQAGLLDFVGPNVPPCETAPVIVLILADLQYQKLLGEVVDSSIKQGCLDEAFRDRKYDFLQKVHSSLNEQELRDQVLIDSSLVSMQLMLIAKERGFDTHAIGIFDREKVLTHLNVDSERYVSVMLLAIGKATVPAVPSARLPLDYTIVWNDGSTFKK